MAGRPSSRLHGTVVDDEINLIPMMNVFCILIPFLILSAVFVQLSVIDTSLPTAMKPGDTPLEQTVKPKLTLTVAMTEEGFTIAGYGGVLDVADSKPDDETTSKQPRYIIPKISENGQLVFDFLKLQENLIKVKDKFPDQYSIILLPEDQVNFQEIIKTMDVSREVKVKDETGKESTRILFPSPVLAGGVS